MTFEENTNHLNRHPSITFAFDCYYRLSRGKKKTLLDDEREMRRRRKRIRVMKKMSTARSSTHTLSAILKKKFFISGVKGKCDAHALIGNITLLKALLLVFFICYASKQSLIDFIQ